MTRSVDASCDTLGRIRMKVLDAANVERWGAQVGRAEALRRTFARADDLERDA